MSTRATRVKDLLDLPESIRKGDFVLKLAEGIEDPRTTAQTYVVTPALADAFDRALRLVGSALRDQKSQAAYLHGSFGSGKSHFMALLSLLLAGNEEAWRIPELHPLREKHPFVGKATLLELHFHMVGKTSIEEAIFGEYLRTVTTRHPDAAVPALFADEKLFDMAAELCNELGDDAFFGPMNEGVQADSRWGKKAAQKQWDRERFDAAARSTDPAVRGELFSALVKTRYKGWQDESRSFVDLDSGLAILARHAAALGYHGVVLFLDELILWLAARAADSAWLHQEAQKMVKLVEAEDMRRDIPLVSFIARQRDLSDMVGEEYAGAENALLRDSLKHWEGRYDKVQLEDKNLPAIVEKRILRPASPAAAAELRSAFDLLKRSAGPAWQALLGSDDAEAFQKLYPFSPALVDVLVALSTSLQRQRTAIKLLMEILVDHIEDLHVGQVVCVGDLFDLLAAGEESADGMMKARFDSAKQLYKHQFLPLIREQNGTQTEARCQRLRKDQVTLGCSNCGERACRTDNRLVKTLLIAALVPETGAVKDLTASRLVQLNHGSVTVPIAGTEASIVAQKLRGWASAVGQLQVGAETDPAVRLRLEGVDLGPILAKADEADTHGARTRVMRDVLFEALGIDKVVERGKDHKVDWKGTWRTGHIQFGNVRTMGPELLRCRDDHDWRLVVDYPFDDAQHGPNDDLEAIERFTEDTAGSWTLVWLPSFFSASMEKLLGELVRLEEILQTTEKRRRYVQDLSVENQSRALQDLENLRSMKKSKLLEVMSEAYGITTARGGDLDSARSIDNHLHLLKPGAKLAPRVPPNMAEAVQDYVEAILKARYPRHPDFKEKLTKRRVEHLVERFGELVDEEGRMAAERALVEEMRGTLQELGLVRVSENALHLVTDRTLQQLEQRRMQKAVDAPSAGEIRRWLDEGDKMGLQSEAEDLVVRCYARWAARTFTYYGKPYEPAAGKPIPDEVVLEKPALPGAVAWTAALDMAATTFGVTLPGKALHADNLKRFEARVIEELGVVARAATELPRRLGEWAPLLGVDDDADRLVTARSADGFVAGLEGQGAVAMVEALEAFVPRTSGRAVGKCLATCVGSVELLGNQLVLGVFQQLADRRAELVGAEELLGRAAEALRQDELHVALTDRLRRLAEEGQRLLSQRPPPPPPGPVGTVSGAGGTGTGALMDLTAEASGSRAAVEELSRLTARARDAIGALDEDAKVTIRVVVTEGKK